MNLARVQHYAALESAGRHIQLAPMSQCYEDKMLSQIQEVLLLKYTVRIALWKQTPENYFQLSSMRPSHNPAVPLMRRFIFYYNIILSAQYET